MKKQPFCQVDLYVPQQKKTAPMIIRILAFHGIDYPLPKQKSQSGEFYLIQ